MPIRNLTERPRMPRLGKIHTGIKVKNDKGNEYPKAVDHFVCPDEVLAALKDKVPFCDGKCGAAPGPTQLPIMFMTNDEEKAASQWYYSYKATVNRVCKGDGYHADALLDAAALKARGGDITAPLPVDVWAKHDSKEVVRFEIDCLGEGFDGAPPCPAYAAAKCKRIMMLQFAIPDAPGLGVYQLDTGSINSILNVNGFLEYLRSFTDGRIIGIPLVLKLVSQEVTAEGKKKHVHVLQLTSDFNIGQIAAAMQKPVINALLPEPDAGDADEFEGFDGQPEDVPPAPPPPAAPAASRPASGPRTAAARAQQAEPETAPAPKTAAPKQRILAVMNWAVREARELEGYDSGRWHKHVAQIKKQYPNAAGEASGLHVDGLQPEELLMVAADLETWRAAIVGEYSRSNGPIEATATVIEDAPASEPERGASGQPTVRQQIQTFLRSAKVAWDEEKYQRAVDAINEIAPGTATAGGLRIGGPGMNDEQQLQVWEVLVAMGREDVDTGKTQAALPMT